MYNKYPNQQLVAELLKSNYSLRVLAKFDGKEPFAANCFFPNENEVIVKAGSDNTKYRKRLDEVEFGYGTATVTGLQVIYCVNAARAIEENEVSGRVYDADTVLRDYMDDSTVEIGTGIGILKCWLKVESVKEQKVVEEMFELFTGEKFKTFVCDCIEQTRIEEA